MHQHRSTATAFVALVASLLVVALATTSSAAGLASTASPVRAGSILGLGTLDLPGSQRADDAAVPDVSPEARAAEASAAAAARALLFPALGRGAVAAGSAGPRVRALQQRLAWAGIRGVQVTDRYDGRTSAAVARFEAKNGIRPDGYADARMVALLTRAARRGDALDPRCTRATVAVCVDKTQKVLRFVSHGRVLRVLDANFGPERGEPGYGRYSRTREGAFAVSRRSAHHVSTGYGTPMRWALFFDGAEAMHFSDYFRRGGYAVRSYGCVDIASDAGARWVFEHAPVGTPFIVYH